MSYELLQFITEEAIFSPLYSDQNQRELLASSVYNSEEAIFSPLYSDQNRRELLASSVYN